MGPDGFRGGVSRRNLLLGGLALTGAGLLTGGLDTGRARAATGPQIVGCDGWGAR